MEQKITTIDNLPDDVLACVLRRCTHTVPHVLQVCRRWTALLYGRANGRDYVAMIIGLLTRPAHRTGVFALTAEALIKLFSLPRRVFPLTTTERFIAQAAASAVGALDHVPMAAHISWASAVAGARTREEVLMIVRDESALANVHEYFLAMYDTYAAFRDYVSITSESRIFLTRSGAVAWVDLMMKSGMDSRRRESTKLRVQQNVYEQYARLSKVAAGAHQRARVDN